MFRCFCFSFLVEKKIIVPLQIRVCSSGGWTDVERKPMDEGLGVRDAEGEMGSLDSGGGINVGGASEGLNDVTPLTCHFGVWTFLISHN